MQPENEPMIRRSGGSDGPPISEKTPRGAIATRVDMDLVHFDLDPKNGMSEVSTCPLSYLRRERRLMTRLLSARWRL